VAVREARPYRGISGTPSSCRLGSSGAREYVEEAPAAQRAGLARHCSLAKESGAAVLIGVIRADELRLQAEGLDGREIAARLSLPQGTLRNYPGLGHLHKLGTGHRIHPIRIRGRERMAMTCGVARGMTRMVQVPNRRARRSEARRRRRCRSVSRERRPKARLRC
jgi:hypothetical protein